MQQEVKKHHSQFSPIVVLVFSTCDLNQLRHSPRFASQRGAKYAVHFSFLLVLTTALSFVYDPSSWVTISNTRSEQLITCQIFWQKCKLLTEKFTIVKLCKENHHVSSVTLKKHPSSEVRSLFRQHGSIWEVLPIVSLFLKSYEVDQHAEKCAPFFNHFLCTWKMKSSIHHFLYKDETFMFCTRDLAHLALLFKTVHDFLFLETQFIWQDKMSGM